MVTQISTVNLYLALLLPLFVAASFAGTNFCFTAERSSHLFKSPYFLLEWIFMILSAENCFLYTIISHVINFKSFKIKEFLILSLLNSTTIKSFLKNSLNKTETKAKQNENSSYCLYLCICCYHLFLSYDICVLYLNNIAFHLWVTFFKVFFRYNYFLNWLI